LSFNPGIFLCVTLAILLILFPVQLIDTISGL
jgi:hypothetical protein